MTTNTTKNPFDLPELRHRLSRFVAIKDAFSCALVSKAWTEDFVSVLWFKIDFSVHPRFIGLSAEIVTKHGHYIQIVENAKTLPQVSILANAGVNNLRELHIDPTASTMQHVRANEIVHRNSLCLETLDLFASSDSSVRRNSPTHFVSASILAPSPGASLQGQSKLHTLKIKRMCLTHDSLIMILQLCPRLTELRLPHTDVVGAPTQQFQHHGVTIFGSSLKSIFQVPRTGPSLLSYFPRMKILCTFNFDPSASIPSDMIKGDISTYCPNITGYGLEDRTGAIVTVLLTTIADKVSFICFKYEKLSSEFITALLMHQTSLMMVQHFLSPYGLELEMEGVPPVSSHFQASGRYLQLIPRGCSRLVVLDLHAHEMDMNEVDKGEWVCKDLMTLRIRVKDLDTKDKILKAIALWRKGCWRRWQEKAGTQIGAEGKLDETDMSIEARVARHLLKFDNLWYVWLGYQTWTPI
ncbi:hypothetical protein BGW39_007705 [Mortierella sp. 14UC]|nr:hypothetical protein BGW39_007705 [Mortierella sp. 14UC]